MDTLPGPIQKVAASILRQVETSIYSDEPTSAAERSQLAEVLGGGPGGCRPGREDLSERQPWFAVVRRQQVALERMEQHVAEMQEVVDTHLARRKSVLDFIVRLQGQERLILQQWLFNFWVFTYRERRARMEKMSSSVLAVPDDLVTPFLSWRLYVSQQRLVRARSKCTEVDKEASQLANKITEVEVENQEQQRLLEESLAAGAELKEKCMVEQQELSRLKQVWADTQPELRPGCRSCAPSCRLTRFFRLFCVILAGCSRFWPRRWRSSSAWWCDRLASSTWRCGSMSPDRQAASGCWSPRFAIGWQERTSALCSRMMMPVSRTPRPS